MIVYNTTFHIENDILDESLAYLKRHYIPKALEGGLLTNPKLRRVMSEEEEDKGINFSVQFDVKDLDTLSGWLQNEGSRLQQGVVARFGHRIAGFSTLLEELDWKS